MQNINKTLELLNLPLDLAYLSSQVKSKVTNMIVEHTITDSTNVEITEINGKKVAKRVTKITKNYISVPTESKFGTYTHNLISIYKDDFGFNIKGLIDNKYILEKPTLIVDTNPDILIQELVKIGGQKVEIETVSDSDFNINLKSSELPNFITIGRIYTSISGTVATRINGTYTVSNIQTSTFKARNTSVSKEYLLSNSNLTENELCEMSSTIFKAKKVNHDTHVTDIATDVKIADNKFKGEVYINGILNKDINYTNLIASMDLKFPQIVQRWRLYNGDVVNEGIYGSTWTKQMAHSENNEISIVAGNAFNWNETTKTLTYDSSKNTHLWYQFECLPAQGKNESWETIIDLKTNTKI